MHFCRAYRSPSRGGRAGFVQQCLMADDKTVPPDDARPLDAAEAALDRLAARLANPSIGAQIRRLLPKIENAIEAGATHEQIVETLCESGIDLSLATFRSALYRARKKLDPEQGKGSRKGGSRGGGPAGSEAFAGGGGGKSAQAASDPNADPDGRQGTRDPLAVPARPKSFEWDPTARPAVTFIKKDDGEPES